MELWHIEQICQKFGKCKIGNILDDSKVPENLISGTTQSVDNDYHYYMYSFSSTFKNTVWNTFHRDFLVFIYIFTKVASRYIFGRYQEPKKKKL